MDDLMAAYSADISVLCEHQRKFDFFLAGRPATEAELKRYLEPMQKRVVDENMDASTLATYTNYITGGKHRHLRKTRVAKAVKAQGGHLGGKRRAPTMPKKLSERILKFSYSKPVTLLKTGMWLQIKMCAPRTCDVSRLRCEAFIWGEMNDRKRRRVHWSYTKSIRSAADAKTTPELEKTEPPFNKAWWEKMSKENKGQPLRDYDYPEVNKQLKELAHDYDPIPTSTSLRLVFIKNAVQKTGSYEKAARFTVHRSGKILSAAYDAPRRESRKR